MSTWADAIDESQKQWKKRKAEQEPDNALPCGHDPKWRIGNPDDAGATTGCELCDAVARECAERECDGIMLDWLEKQDADCWARICRRMETHKGTASSVGRSSVRIAIIEEGAEQFEERTAAENTDG